MGVSLISQYTLLHQKPQLPNSLIKVESPESQASDLTKFINATSAVAVTTKAWPFSHGSLHAYLIGTTHQEWLLKEHFHKTLLFFSLWRLIEMTGIAQVAESGPKDRSLDPAVLVLYMD